MEKENRRSRIWYLTITNDSECYEYVDYICKGLSKKCKYVIASSNNLIQVVLLFENAHTSKSILKKFPGAKIEEHHSIKYFSSFLSNESKITHKNVDLELWKKGKVHVHYFNPQKIYTYIQKDNFHSIVSFYLYFGAQIQPHLELIQALLDEEKNNWNKDGNNL